MASTTLSDRSPFDKDQISLLDRAGKISELTKLLSDELGRQNISEPTFEHGMPMVLMDPGSDSEVSRNRVKLLGMLDEFRALLTEPFFHLHGSINGVYAVMQMGILDVFPSDGISVQDLAKKVNRRPDIIRRILGFCSTHHVFHQAAPDFFVHTASSRMLTSFEGNQIWAKTGATEMIPATMKIADALVKFPNSEEPEHCGCSLYNDTDLPFFKAIADRPERAALFNKGVEMLGQLPGMSPQHAVTNFPWPVDGRKIKVVDVGGGLGHIARALAEHDPNVEIIVQDLPKVLLQGQKDLPPALQDRIRFQESDFFQNQTVKDADVYFLRMILHDWSDKYARKILQALTPALKPGAKVVIMDRVIPDYGQVHYLTEREARENDMYMLAFQNAKERSADEWNTLIKEADERFALTNINSPAKSSLALIEVTWNV